MSTELTITEAAHLLGVSVQRVRTLCRSERLPCRKVGVSWLIDRESVLRYGLATAHRIAEDHPTYMMKPNKPVALSFFSGAMGLDLGMEQAGFDIRLVCEIDKYCRQTITLNRPDVALIGDITSYTPDEILRFAGLSHGDTIDLLYGGPPCQAFSTAGKRNGFQDARGNLFLRFLDIAFALRPQYFVIENVRGLLSSPLKHRPHDMRGADYPPLEYDEQPGGALYFVLALIERAGYAYSFNLYNAANFGSPQIRERVVIICSRNGLKPPFLQPTHAEGGQHGLPSWRSFGDVTRDLTQHHHINFPEKRLTFYRMLKEGQNWRSLPPDRQEEALGNAYYAGGGKTGFLRRLAWNKPAPTLVTHPAMPATDLAHPEADRPLSIEEYKRVQEFPDAWELAGPLIEQYRQVGNAVPVSLGRAIGTLIQQLLRQAPVASLPSFSYSRYRNTSDVEWKQRFQHISTGNRAVQMPLFDV
jgi:DNA (cytosine-5)-methyltransferase 1